MNVQHVPVQFVNQTWPEVAEFLYAAICQQEGELDYTLDQVRTLVVTGQWMLIIATDGTRIKGAATISFTNRPHHRVAFITYIGGRLVVSKESFAQMCHVLKSFGATSIEGAVNDAVARLWRRFGFTEKYKIVSVTL